MIVKSAFHLWDSSHRKRMKTNLKKTKTYYLKLMEPNGIGKEDKILDDISQDGDNDERLPAIVVRERSSKQSENNCRQALKETVVSLMRIVL